MGKDILIASYDDVVREFGEDKAAELLSDAVYDWDWVSSDDIKEANANNRGIYLDQSSNDWDDLNTRKDIIAKALADVSGEWVDDGVHSDAGNAAERLRGDLIFYLDNRLNSDSIYIDSNNNIRKDIAKKFVAAIEDELDERGDTLTTSDKFEQDLTGRFGFDFDFKTEESIDNMQFETTLMLYEGEPWVEGELVDAVLDWRCNNLELEFQKDEFVYVKNESYQPFARPTDVPHTVFDSLCESQGTTIEKVVNNPVSKFEKSFQEDLFNCQHRQQADEPGLTVMCTMESKDFITACTAMNQNHHELGSAETFRTMTAEPGKNEPIMGVYDPQSGWAGTMGIVLDKPFEIDMQNIKWAMQEPEHGEWEGPVSLYTPQDCCGFVNPFRGKLKCEDVKAKNSSTAGKDGLERYKAVSELVNDGHATVAVEEKNH